jgi:hypothetical protein
MFRELRAVSQMRDVDRGAPGWMSAASSFFDADEDDDEEVMEEERTVERSERP